MVRDESDYRKWLVTQCFRGRDLDPEKLYDLPVGLIKWQNPNENQMTGNAKLGLEIPMVRARTDQGH